jgi:solute:Na+ symporter, SSS family
MTPLQFTWLDWGILGGYVVILAIAGYLSTRRNM